MLNSRPLWRAGLRARDITPRIFSILAFTPPMILIWEEARKNPAVIISKDEDFVDHWLLDKDPVPLVWIRKGNCSNHALLEWLGPLWPEVLRRLDEGEKLIELRA